MSVYEFWKALFRRSTPHEFFLAPFILTLSYATNEIMKRRRCARINWTLAATFEHTVESSRRVRAELISNVKSLTIFKQLQEMSI
jgi:hypothetical protein